MIGDQWVRLCSGKALKFIVGSAANDDHGLFHYLTDDAMFIIDESRPVTAKIVLERLGLSQAIIWISRYVSNEFIDFS